MKKKILNFWLLTLMVMLGGMNAWGADVNATLDHTAGAQWGSNTGASTVDAEKEHYNNDAASSWAGCAYAKFSFTLPEGHSITKATLTYSVNQGGRASRNDIIYYMEKGFDLDWANFAGQTATDLRNAGNRAGKAVASAPTGGTGDRIGLVQDVTDAVKAIYGEGQSYIIFQWTGNAGGADLYGKASANAPTLVIETADASSVTSYTVRFTDGTNDLKDAAVYDGVMIGSEQTASAEDMASFMTNEKKYIYSSGNTTITLAAEATSNVITLVFREAAIVNYTLTDATTGTLLAEGTGFEEDVVNAYYPHYILSEGNLYECPKQGSNPWYGIALTLGASATSATVDYTALELAGVVFASEGEAIPGARKNTGNYADIRSFGGAVGYSAEDLVIVKLSAGKYKIKADLFTPTSAMGSQKIRVGEQLFTLTSESNGYHNEVETEEFEITEATDVVWVGGSTGTNAIDWLYITGTGSVVEDTPDDALPLTLTFPDYNDASISAYTAEWTATVDGKVWTLNGFNNNKNGWAFVRCGQKSVDQTATITSPVVNAEAKNVVITVDKTSNVTAATLDVLNGENVVTTIDITEKFVAGDVNVPVEGAKGYSYKLTIQSTAGSNGTTQISKVAIYAEGQYKEPVHIANTAETAYTVSEAIALIDAGESLSETVFVKGIISKVEKYNEDYKSINYWISEDGTEEAAQFECYSGKGLDGADFESIDDVKTGASVIVTGQLTKYNEIYEFKSGNKLVSYEYTDPTPIVDVETGVETEKDQKGGNKNTTAEGVSYSIDGTFIAGTGSAMAEPMTSKGLKFRTNQEGGTLRFDVREGYTLTKLTMAAISNYVLKDGAEEPCIFVTKVEADGVETAFEGGNFPAKGASEAGVLTISNIQAKQAVTIYFDNSNASGTQINASWEVEWSRPMASQPTINIARETLALVPGATFQLSGNVDPAKYTEEVQWVSDNEAVATVAEDGTVTAVAAGTANISLQWTKDATIADAVALTVSDFDPASYQATNYDFTAMGDVTLEIQSEAAGAIWNEVNNKPNDVFFCTNEGLENIAVQAVLDSKNKGWSIVNEKGLALGAGAGRCAAINTKAGQIVEIIYTGTRFVTGSKNDAVRKDDGAAKIAFNESTGRAIYKMEEDGLLGFELNAGEAVQQINVYEEAIPEFEDEYYEIAEEYKSIAELEGKNFVILNKADKKALFGSGNQNLGYDVLKTAMATSNATTTFKIENSTVANSYLLRTITPAGAEYSIWGNPGYLNSQPATGGCSFILGLNNQNGQDGENLAVWDIQYVEGKGFTLKNVGTGLYLNDNLPAKYEEPAYWTFCTVKEKEITDPLAEPKKALNDEIALAEMQNSFAKTAESFAALTDAIAAAKAALEAADATEESLNNAKKAVEDAVAGLTLAEGYSDLTKDMFKHWDSATEPTTGEATNCAYELFVPSGLPYGDGSVGYLNYADLSEYDELTITVADGTPRLLMNRLVNEGPWNDDEAQSQMIEMPKDGTWSDRFYTKSEDGKTFTYNLKLMTEEKGFAHLNSIKGANWANVTVTGMYLKKAPAIIAFEGEGKFYLKNVASGKFWGAGNDWGTRASLVKHPEFVTLAKLEDGTYTLESQVSNGGTAYYFNGDYMDDGSPVSLTIMQAADGEWTIANGDNYFGYDGTSTVLGKNLDKNSEAAHWQILSEADMQALMATATASEPVDATYLILDPNFSRNNRNWEQWTKTAGNPGKGGENTNMNVESYMSTFDLNQTLTVPNGVYKVDAQAAVTFHDNRAIKEYDGNGYPVVYANEAASNFNEMIAADQLSSQSKMSQQFNAGNYAVEPVFVEVTDGNLVVGAKSDRDDIWAVWDNFQLTYYGANASIDEVKNAAVIQQLADLRAKAQQEQGEVEIDAVKAALAEALAATENVEPTLDALNAAIATLNAAIDKADASLTAKNVLPKMKQLVDQTNVYTAEALNEYYTQWAAKYEDGTLTKNEAAALQDPFLVTGWHAAITVDNFLLSAWDTNPDFLDAPYYINTWSVEGNNDGSEFKVPFFEYWTGDGESLGERTLTATMNNLEAGEYEVAAWARVRAKNGYEAPAYGITLQANEGEAVNVAAGQQVGESQFYLDHFTATGVVGEDGVLNIKFNIAADNNISWLSFQNVQFQSKAVLAAKDELQQHVETAQAADTEGKTEASVAALNAAIAAAQAVLNNLNATAAEVAAAQAAVDKALAGLKDEGEMDVVTPPADLATEDWMFNGYYVDSYGESYVNRIVKVGFSGSDVYIQGISNYLEDAWIQGTMNAEGNAITVAAPQYYGSLYGTYNMYFGLNIYDEENKIDDYPASIELGYDAETGVITIPETLLILEKTSPELSFDGTVGYYAATSLKKRPDYQTVEVPENLVAEEWYFQGQNSTDSDTEFTVNVGFDGNDIYVQGLCTLLPEGWVKGTIDGTTATFATGQYFGMTNKGYDMFMLGYNKDGIADLVLTYDAEAGSLTADENNLMIINELPDELYYHDYYSYIEITKEAPAELVEVEVPENLKPTDYLFLADDATANTEESRQTRVIRLVEDASANTVERCVQVMFDGSDVYFKGLVGFLPESYSKGTLSEDGKTITIPGNQYVGMTYDIDFDTWQFIELKAFLWGASKEDGSIGDLVLSYDAEGGKMTTDQYVLVNGSRRFIKVNELYDNARLEIPEIATPAMPTIIDVVEEENFFTEEMVPAMKAEIPLVDIYGDKIYAPFLSYRVYKDVNGIQEPFIFDQYAYYEYEDLKNVPYTKDDGAFFYEGASLVLILTDNFDLWKRIGLRSVYTVNGKVRESEIFWFNIGIDGPTVGIDGINANDLNAEFYDMQGRKVARTAKGLLIKQQQQADGSMKTMKVVRK